MRSLVMETLGWSSLLVTGVGVVVSAVGVTRSKWALLLLGGFCGEAAVSLVFRLRLFDLAGVSGREFVYVLTSAIGLAARCAVVAGVAGLLLGRPAQDSTPAAPDLS